jgi:hypothetical protein
MWSGQRTLRVAVAAVVLHDEQRRNRIPDSLANIIPSQHYHLSFSFLYIRPKTRLFIFRGKRGRRTPETRGDALANVLCFPT